MVWFSTLKGLSGVQRRKRILSIHNMLIFLKTECAFTPVEHSEQLNARIEIHWILS